MTKQTDWAQGVVWATGPKFRHHQSDGPLDEAKAKALIAGATELMIGGLASLSALPAMAKLSRLVVADAGGTLDDLEGVERFSRLEALEVERHGLTDLSPLAALTRLERLNLAGNAVSDLGPLAACVALESLVLTKNPVRELTPLAGLRKLARLGLSKTRVKDLSPLAALPKLAELKAPTSVPAKALAAFKAEHPKLAVSF